MAVFVSRPRNFAVLVVVLALVVLVLVSVTDTHSHSLEGSVSAVFIQDHALGTLL